MVFCWQTGCGTGLLYQSHKEQRTVEWLWFTARVTVAVFIIWLNKNVLNFFIGFGQTVALKPKCSLGGCEVMRHGCGFIQL